MDDKKRIEKICKRASDIKDANANWYNYYQQLAEFCLPRKAQITQKRSPGDKLKMENIYDSTAMRSLKIMAAGFHSNLTNPSSKWFNLRTRDLKIMDSKDVQVWFKDVEDSMFGTLASSNFDCTMQEFYLNSGCFGTGVVLTLEDVREKVRFSEIAIDQVVMEEDAYGRVNRVYRTFKLTAQQAFDLWGDKAGEAVKELVEKKPTDKLEFLHYVGPRDKRDPSREDNSNMPYESLWIEKSKKHLIGEGGYKENPYSAGRFYKDSEDVLGYSPAMDALYEIKGVNAQKKTLLRAAMKAADPAIIAPRKGWVSPLNANPGKINYRDKMIAGEEVQMFPSSGNIPITLEIIQAEQNSIKETFFVPLFQALSQITKQMTVPEVQQRVAENMVLLGPTIGRFTQEMLDPILTRVFGILFDAGEFPMPPQELQGQEMDIVYISPLAKAQRQSEIYSLQAFMQDVGMVATAIPEVMDKIDGDRGVDISAQIRGIDPTLLKDKGDVDATRQARAQQQQQMMQAQQMAQGAETVATGAKATKDLKEAQETEE